MIDLAVRHDPDESCGLFAGPPGSMYVDTFFPIANVAPPERRPEIYTLDGVGQLDAENSADAAGLSTDIADAARFDEFGVWVFLIVSLEHPEPYMRAFRISGDVIKEVSVAVESG